MGELKISIIISTYNSPKWLEKVLWGYSIQTYKNYDIIIADDGSKNSTKELIDSFRKEYPYPIIHIWHEDKGYRRQELLNKSILECTGDYIIMTDGDCIPRRDLVEVHAKHAQKGRFLSGGYCKLSEKTSKIISKDDILKGLCFNVKWLKSKDKKIGFSQTLKLNSPGIFVALLDLITPTGATFNNMNSSGWKKDYIAINGYDERMQYGGSDRELGERLNNYGIKGKQIRHKAICLHLDHPRGYANKESWKLNNNIRKNTRNNKIVRTPFGIQKS
jgi:glycosyltransferase involved in cell wall biosynthesis